MKAIASSVALLALLSICGCAIPSRPLFTHDQVQQIRKGDSEAQVDQIMPAATIKTNALPHIDIWVWQNPRRIEPLLARVLFQDSKVLTVDEFSAIQAAALQQQNHMDQILGHEPALVRAIYLANHPDLDANLQRYVKEGLMTTAWVEQRRLDELELKRLEAATTEHFRQARAQAEQDRKDYASSHPEVPKEIRDAILKQRLVIGMTAEQVKLSYGAPKAVNSITTAAGRTETWTFYGRDTVATLSGGRLASFSE